MADTPVGAVKIQAELDTTKALAALQTFKAEVAAMGQGTNLGQMQQAAAGATRDMRGLVTALQVAVGEADAVAQALKQVGKTSSDTNKSATREVAEQRRLERERIKDAEYLNRTLTQRQAILSKLSATLGGRQFAALSQAQQQAITGRFGPQAVRDLNELPGMANAQALARNTRDAQAELQRYHQWFIDAERRTQGQVTAAADQYNRSRAAGDRAVAQTRKSALAAAQAEDERYNRWVIDADRRTQAAILANARDFAASRVRGQKELQAAIEQTNTAQMAAAKQNISQAQFENRTLTQKLRILNEIAAAEARSIAAGTGRISANSALAQALTGRYGAGAMDAYRTGARSDIVMELENTAKLTPAATAGSAARAAALNKERLAAKAAAVEYREMHSVARGLAGSSGMLWLTYGSMLPMAMGAAAAATATSMTKQGANFAENMAFVRQLSEDSAPGLEALNAQITSIGDNLLEQGRRGRFGALQLSESMRVLAQAGFDAQQSATMLPAVKNLSIIGETTPDKSALTVAGTLSAFGMQAEQSGRIADVISLAAAKSQTGVPQLMESMKQASSVAQDYNASLEETAAVLTLLAQRNITGSAAGTAFRNMLVDLGGRTPKSTAAMKELGVSLYDVNGRARATKDVLTDLINILSTQSPAIANSFINRIFTERGRRAASAVMGAGANQYSGLVDAFGQASDNGGFAQRQAQALNTTPIAEYQKAINGLSSSMIEGFGLAEDRMKAVAVTMQQAFASDEFRSYISGISTSTAGIAEFVVNNGRLLATVGEGILLFGAARLAMSTWTIAVMAAGTATNTYRAAVTAVTVAQGAYTTATAMGASATRGAAIATTAATGAVRGLFVALGPVGVALTAAAAAMVLFSDSADSVKNLDINLDPFRNVEYYKYEDVRNQYHQVLEGMKAETGAFGRDSVKTMQDVQTQMLAGESSLKQLRERMESDRGTLDNTANQFILDQRAAFYQQMRDQAARHNSGSEQDQAALAEISRKYANAQVEIQDEAMRLLSERSAQAVADQVAKAAQVGFAWSSVWEGLKETWNTSFLDSMGDLVRGVGQPGGQDTFGRGYQRNQNSRQAAALQGAIDPYLNKLGAANEQGIRYTGDLAVVDQLLKQAGQMPGIDATWLNSATNTFKMSQDIARAQTQANAAKSILSSPITGDNGLPPNQGRPDRSASNAAKQRAEIAKDELKQYQEQLKIRQRLDLFTTEGQFQRERDLQIAAEMAEYEASREKIVYDMARAEKSANGEAIETMRENLDLLDRQHAGKLQTIRLDYEADRIQRDTKKRLEDINVILNARSNIMEGMRVLYGSTDGYQTKELSRMAEAAAITKARYDQAKQMEALTDAPVEVRMLATEQRRFELAQEIFKIRREENKLLIDSARTVDDLGRSVRNSIDEQVRTLASARTAFTDDVFSGLSAGSQSGFNQLFAYIKNPGEYRSRNDGQDFGASQLFGAMGGGIFDAVAQGLSRNMTESMMTSLSGIMQQLGFKSDADIARETAEREVAMNTANMASALTVTIPELLRGIYSAVGGTDQRTLAIGGSGAKAAAGTEETATQLADQAGQTQSAFGSMIESAQSGLQALGMTNTQVMGMMFMGFQSMANGGSKVFAQFVKSAIAQLVMLWAWQKLVGMAAGSAAPVATAMPVNMGSSVTMAPLANADGTGYVDAKGHVKGTGGRRDDTVLSWLSHGEGVVNADAVAYYGPGFIDALNRKQVSRNAFADGGIVAGPRSAGQSSAESGTSLTFEFNISDNGAGGGGGRQDNGQGFDSKNFQRDMESAVLDVLGRHAAPGQVFNVLVKDIVTN